MKHTAEHPDGVLIDPSEIRVVSPWISVLLAICGLILIAWAAGAFDQLRGSGSKAASLFSSGPDFTLACTSHAENQDDYLVIPDGTTTILVKAGNGCQTKWVRRPSLENGQPSGDFVVDPKNTVRQRFLFAGKNQPGRWFVNSPLGRQIEPVSQVGLETAVQFTAGKEDNLITIRTQ